MTIIVTIECIDDYGQVRNRAIKIIKPYYDTIERNVKKLMDALEEVESAIVR